MGNPNVYSDEIPDIVWVNYAGHPGVQTGILRGDPMIDSEGVCAWEPYGWSFFSWKKRRCRNGKVRWLTRLQKHADGTFTKCNLG